MKIGRYEIDDNEKPLGEGGGGIVYRARDTNIGRIVAIKMLSFAADGNEESEKTHRELFLREARNAGQLSHQNIVTVYDVIESGDKSCIVMEFINGQTLESLLTSKPA